MLSFSPLPFLCVFLVFCATACSAFSCAFRYVGAFSHGLDRCTISFRFAVVSLADNDWVRGIPYVTRYDFPSKLWSLRCRIDNCLTLAPHARQVTVCLVMLFFQWTGFGCVSGVATATIRFESS